MKNRRNISRKAPSATLPPRRMRAGAKAQRKDGEVKGDSAIGIWIVRPQGFDLGQHLAAELGGKCYAPDEILGLTNREAFSDQFHEHRQWVLVMTTGIAVRYLQGLLTSKESDPGVVVLDEGCRFAVSLLGGHEGGANQLAYRVANLMGALPVITTATETLKPLVIGVGCRRGVSSEQIDSAIEHGLGLVQRSRSEVREIATIDLKQDELGLNEWCQSHEVPLRVIHRELVQQRPWVTKPSDWVRESIGVDGVCEACALLATFRGRLLLPKTIRAGVTVAIVEEKTEISPHQESTPELAEVRCNSDTAQDSNTPARKDSRTRTRRTRRRRRGLKS
jgi:cobalt-precorrin 5A hydrolase